MDRREFLAVCSASASIGIAGCGGNRWELTGDSTSPIEPGPEIGVNSVAEGTTEPLQMVFSSRDNVNYIAEKYGRIFFHNGSTVRDDPFLDISDNLVDITNWEQGLLGLTLHPNFTENRRFFVRYSAPPKAEYPSDFSHTFRLSEFRAGEGLQHADPMSERVVLEIPQRNAIHQAGGIVFGPDGYLYVAVGDDGGVFPPDASYNRDWYLVNKGGNGQNTTNNLKGSILRIDVDNVENGRSYSIPEDNPLVGEDGKNEYFAWGFRNPYRMSFDRDQLYVADVGNGMGYEEINLVERGGNYGWSVREGPSCVNANAALSGDLNVMTPSPVDDLLEYPPFSLFDSLASHFGLDELPACPTETPSGEEFIDPVVVYPHVHAGRRLGSAVIGGYMYRNSTVEQLRGKFVFGDLFGGGSGRVYAAEPQTEKPWTIEEIGISNTEGGELDEAILSFARDRDGELYILSTEFSEGSGSVYEITP